MERLPTEVLRLVFTKASAEDRRLSLPLVCRLWHQILLQPDATWERLVIDLFDQRPWLASLTWQRLLNLFAGCGPHIRTLILKNQEEEDSVVGWSNATGAPEVSALRALPRLCPGLTSLPRLCPGLTSLTIDRPQGDFQGRDLDVLTGLSHLRSLRLTQLERQYFPAASLVSLSLLTQLTELRLTYTDKQPRGNGTYAIGFPPVVLGLSHLSVLELDTNYDLQHPHHPDFVPLVPPPAAINPLAHLRELSLVGLFPPTFEIVDGLADDDMGDKV
ncbi:hypothetical protein WJX72_005470 [[Myrmecia] bisecta]|uniref:F-box domain-containing protein n=1 Tax=[Myrmecia] bisecta TaxID=41462 RepID=A0AAW1PXM6_9CHLO